MSLALLVPAFLIGLGLLAIPIVVHLRQRERKEPIQFPSLMFLSRLPHRTSERRRLTYRLLLLLRALAVALVVAAFARPFLKRDADHTQTSGAGRAVVILVDRSMSMGYRDVWSRAIDSVNATLATLRSADRVALIAFDETAELLAPLAQDPATVGAALGSLRPTGRSTRFPPAFRLANEAATRGRGLRPELVVVTDLQRHGTIGLETVDRLPGTTLRVVSVAPTQPANARVVDAQIDQTAEGRRGRLVVSARVATKAVSGWESKARLIVGGRPLDEKPVRLRPNAIETIRFDPVTVPATEAVATVALDPDALPADDSLRFTLGAATGVSVILLLPNGMPTTESLFLERALAISRSPSLNVLTRRASTIALAELERASAVVIGDLSTVSAAGLSILGRFVQGGGGVVAFSGRRGSAARRPAGWVPAGFGGIVDRTSDNGGRLGQVDADHPAFEPFKAAISSDFGAARFFRYHELTTDSSAIVLGRFDDGRPALVERRLGAGRAVVAAFPADAIWSDVVLQPVFLPLVQRLVAHTAGLVDSKRWFAVGDAAPLPVTEALLTVQSPAGTKTSVRADSSRTVTLGEPGIYQVTAVGETAPVARFAVNPPAIESELTPVDAAEVDLLFQAGSDSTAQREASQLTVAEQERAQSWWVWLLLGALILLVAEALYAGRVQRSVRPIGGAT